MALGLVPNWPFVYICYLIIASFPPSLRRLPCCLGPSPLPLLPHKPLLRLFLAYYGFYSIIATLFDPVLATLFGPRLAAIFAVKNRPPDATPLRSSVAAVAVSRGICAVENRPQNPTPLRFSAAAVAGSRGFCTVKNRTQDATPLRSSVAAVAASRAIFPVEIRPQVRALGIFG
ncbi:hypothetical protein C8R45DRAFT_1222974 [Mycena sanguinolenta]|nr:hypothetical protein C8R45DRAFT_1222974 [Mycena sanguinolenta]